MGGVTKTEFKPQTYVSKGEFIDILVKTLSLSAEFDENFSDVKKSSPWYQSIGIAKELGITKGIGNNLLKPETAITRQEMAILAVRALQLVTDMETSKNTSDLNQYTDASKVSKYARVSIAALLKEDLLVMNGKTIKPTEKVTRAEAAVTAYRIYNYIY